MDQTHTHTPIHNGILFNLEKKKEILSLATTWKNLEDAMLSEIGQRKSNNTAFSHLHVTSKKTTKKVRLIETEIEVVTRP